MEMYGNRKFHQAEIETQTVSLGSDILKDTHLKTFLKEAPGCPAASLTFSPSGCRPGTAPLMLVDRLLPSQWGWTSVG